MADRELSNAPASKLVDITPGTSELSPRPRAFYVGVSGDVEIVDADDNTVVLHNLQAGVPHPVSPKKILATNTNATDIVGIL